MAMAARAFGDRAGRAAVAAPWRPALLGSHPRRWPTTRRSSVVAAAFSAAAAAASCSGAAFGSAPSRAPCPAAVWRPPALEVGRHFAGRCPPEGLRYAADFVAPDEELELVLSEGPWLGHLKSRAQQFFGLIYYQTTHDVPELQPGLDTTMRGRLMEELPSWLLDRVLATGTFSGAEEINQVAANEYTGNVGIASHVEDPTSFGAKLATLSLLAPVQLTLTPWDQAIHERNGVDHGNWVKVLLEPRSLLVLQGESRYAFRHGIRKSKLVQFPDGSTLKRDAGYRRISLTFRELLESRRKLLGGEQQAQVAEVC